MTIEIKLKHNFFKLSNIFNQKVKIEVLAIEGLVNHCCFFAKAKTYKISDSNSSDSKNMQEKTHPN